MMNTESCNHDRLHFGSGGYYIFCADCGAKWCRHAVDRPEYGISSQGTMIGAEPDDTDDPQGERINPEIVHQRAGAAEAENTELKEKVIAYGIMWAVQYANDHGLPEGHLAATHYDDLEAAGARMVDFTRAER